ncbi:MULTISPECIES: hypothetical protein [unclassified Geodermatophilus]|uniref:hypothetical protein n=1 Tax=unclassified Geodermatophilus TaxID=2637632 RepID=UPI003EE8AED3
MTVQVHAWLEHRELPGLAPALRARVTVPAADIVAGAGSLEAIHETVDRFLRDAGLIGPCAGDEA